MALPIIVGWSDKIERTGPSFQAVCPTCQGEQRFYEAKKKFNVTAFFSVSLWDSEEPVVQCAHCQGCFEPEDVTRLATAAEAPSLRTRIADAIGRAKSEAESSKAEAKRREDDELAAELAAMKKRLKR